MNTTFPIVKDRIDSEFAQLLTDQGKANIKKCIKKSLKIIGSFYDELKEDGAADDALSDYSDTDSEVDFSIDDVM